MFGLDLASFQERRPQLNEKRRTTITPVTGIAAVAGAAIGFAIGRLTVSSSKAVTVLAHALVRQTNMSTAAPILATALTATASIAGAIILPSIVWWVLRRAEREEGRYV